MKRTVRRILSLTVVTALVLTYLIVPLSTAADTALQEIPLTNGGFETGDATGWPQRGGNWDIVSTDAYEGNYCLWLDSNATNTYPRIDRVLSSLEANTNYVLTFYYKSATNAHTRFEIEGATGGGYIDPSTTWVQRSVNIKTGAGTTATVWIKQQWSTNGECWIDDVHLYKESSVVLPTAVELNTDAISGAPGESVSLTATVTPSEAENKTVTWSSDNTAVATVTAAGTVDLLTEGTATITATTVNGLTDTCTVTVSRALAVEVESIALAPEYRVALGSTATLTATVLPDNASDKTVSWSSAATGIVTVDETGTLTPVAEGETTVTAETVNGLTATTTVIVEPQNLFANPHFSSNTGWGPNANASWDAAYGETGGGYRLEGGHDGAGGSILQTRSRPAGKDLELQVRYKSEGNIRLYVYALPGYSLVSATGDSLTATATWRTAVFSIPAAQLDDSFTSVQIVFSKAWESGVAYIDSAALYAKGTEAEVTQLVPKPSKTALTQGETLTVPVAVYPRAAAGKALTWSSNDAGVATVSQTGVITANGAGEAEITVSADGISAHFTVTVEGKNYIENGDFSSDNGWSMNGDTAIVADAGEDGSPAAVVVGHGDSGLGGLTRTVTNLPTDRGLRLSFRYRTAAGQLRLIAYHPTVSWDVVLDIYCGASPEWSTFTYDIPANKVNATMQFDFTGMWSDTRATVDEVRLETLPEAVDAESVTVAPAALSLSVGTTGTLTATVLPARTTDKSVTWTSGNTAVCTVNADGVVTAVAVGTTTVTAETVNGLTASATVTVTPRNLINNGNFENGSTGFNLKANASISETGGLDGSRGLILGSGSTGAADCMVYNLKNQTKYRLSFYYKTDGPNTRLTVNNGWSSTLTSSNIGLSADWMEYSCVLMVGSADTWLSIGFTNGYTGNGTTYIDALSLTEIGPVVMPTAVEIVPATVRRRSGTAFSLATAITPADADRKTVTWQSNDASVAEVAADGKVSLLREGTAIITATTVNGLTATCTVTVDDAYHSSGTLNVRDFGAVGDGITDDDAAFQAAFNASLMYDETVITVPAGTYLFRKTVQIKPNITLQFESGAKLLRARGDQANNLAKGYMFFIVNDTYNDYDAGYFKVYNGVFDGNYTSADTMADNRIDGYLATDYGDYSSQAIAVAHLDGFVLKDCLFIDAACNEHMIDISGCRNVEITGCEFRGVQWPEETTVRHLCNEVIQIDLGTGYPVQRVTNGVPSVNVNISGNRFVENPANTNSRMVFPIGSHTDAGLSFDTVGNLIELGNYRNIRIADNYIENPIADASRTSALFNLGSAKDVWFTGNRIVIDGTRVSAIYKPLFNFFPSGCYSATYGTAYGTVAPYENVNVTDNTVIFQNASQISFPNGCAFMNLSSPSGWTHAVSGVTTTLPASHGVTVTGNCVYADAPLSFGIGIPGTVQDVTVQDNRLDLTGTASSLIEDLTELAQSATLTVGQAQEALALCRIYNALPAEQQPAEKTDAFIGLRARATAVVADTDSLAVAFEDLSRNGTVQVKTAVTAYAGQQTDVGRETIVIVNAVPDSGYLMVPGSLRYIMADGTVRRILNKNATGFGVGSGTEFAFAMPEGAIAVLAEFAPITEQSFQIGTVGTAVYRTEVGSTTPSGVRFLTRLSFAGLDVRTAESITVRYEGKTYTVQSFGTLAKRTSNALDLTLENCLANQNSDTRMWYTTAYSSDSTVMELVDYTDSYLDVTVIITTENPGTEFNAISYDVRGYLVLDDGAGHTQTVYTDILRDSVNGALSRGV